LIVDITNWIIPATFEVYDQFILS